jgi:hypothetical protein
MELDWAVLADHVSPRSDGKFDIIGAGFDTINAREVPARHPRFVLAIRFLLTPDEAASEHELSVVLRTPDGDELSRAGGPVPVVPDEHMRRVSPGENVGVGLGVAFEDVIFPDFGNYTLALEWDGTETLALTIRVVELPRSA